MFVRSEDAARAIRELNGREWAGAGRGAGVRVRARFDRESPERNAPGRERDGGRERGGDRDREREGVREREREVRRDGPLVVDGSRGKSVVVVRRHRRRRDVRGEGGSEESAGSESESGESSSDGEYSAPLALVLVVCLSEWEGRGDREWWCCADAGFSQRMSIPLRDGRGG